MDGIVGCGWLEVGILVIVIVVVGGISGYGGDSVAAGHERSGVMCC